MGEAAERLGISEDAVRKRLQRGTLAVQPARMQSNRSQNAVNSRRSAYSSVLSVRLLSAGGANRNIPERNASAVCAEWRSRTL